MPDKWCLEVRKKKQIIKRVEQVFNILLSLRSSYYEQRFLYPIFTNDMNHFLKNTAVTNLIYDYDYDE